MLPCAGGPYLPGRKVSPKSGVKLTVFSQICRRNGLLLPQFMQQSMDFDKSKFSLPSGFNSGITEIRCICAEDSASAELGSRTIAALARLRGRSKLRQSGSGPHDDMRFEGF